MFGMHLVVAVPRFYAALAPLWEIPGRSYEDKMREKWGSYFELMQFVQRTTPENAVLLHDPTDYRWLAPYFLYPRRLLFGGEMMLREHPEIEYVLIRDDYPTSPVTGERLMLNDTLGLYKIRR
jgi:hypothetical protein